MKIQGDVTDMKNSTNNTVIGDWHELAARVKLPFFQNS